MKYWVSRRLWIEARECMYWPYAVFPSRWHCTSPYDWQMDCQHISQSSHHNLKQKTIFDEHSVAVPELIRVVYEEVHEVALEAVVCVLGQTHWAAVGHLHSGKGTLYIYVRISESVLRLGKAFPWCYTRQKNISFSSHLCRFDIKMMDWLIGCLPCSKLCSKPV